MGLIPDFHSGAQGLDELNGLGDVNHVDGSEAMRADRAASRPPSHTSSSVPPLYTDYSAGIQMTLENMPWQQVHRMTQAIVEAWEAGAQILLMGNGGSASTASHLACDLSKNTAQPGLPRVRALSFNDNMAVFSAYANDVGYDAVFAEQIRTEARPGDLVIAISTSGNSPNILRAVEAARSMHLRTVGLCGYSGGKLAGMVDIAVTAPNHCVEQIEDIHVVVAHMVTVAVRRAMQTALLRRADFRNGALTGNPPLRLPQPNVGLPRNGFDAGHNNNHPHEGGTLHERSGHSALDGPARNAAGHWRSAPPLSGHD